VSVRFKHGRMLVGDRTAKSRLDEVRVTESQFADDIAVYTTSRESFECATEVFVRTASTWGLTVNIEKTKGMVAGRHSEEDRSPVCVAGGSIEVVGKFTYLGSVIADDGELNEEVSCRLAKAARAFGCLRRSVFQNSRLSISTKRAVYRSVVLAVLLDGSETWTIKTVHTRKLNAFHNRCIRTMLGVTRHQQWREHISSGQLAAKFGMSDSISDILMGHRMRWLGHVGRMEEHRLPKQLLFGELRKKRPSHGTKKRWRDGVMADLRAMGVEDDWYTLCQDRREWSALCREGIEVTRAQRQRQPSMCRAISASTATTFPCPCGRMFRRQGDLTRHSRFCGSINAAL
jgi:hypothetical protein